VELLGAKAGDLILFALGDWSSANQILGRLRLFIALKMEVIDTVSHKLRNILIFFICCIHFFDQSQHGRPLHIFYTYEKGFKIYFENTSVSSLNSWHLPLHFLVNTVSSLGDRFSNVRMEQWWAEIWGQLFLIFYRGIIRTAKFFVLFQNQNGYYLLFLITLF
jgi:hypothetical protein